MISTVNSYEEFQEILQQEPAALMYFSHEECNVCKVLKPKVAELITEEFPKVKLFYVDIKETPVISGQERIFTVPTIIVYLEGKEYIRKSRSIGLDELRRDIERPYQLLFEE